MSAKSRRSHDVHTRRTRGLRAARVREVSHQQLYATGHESAGDKDDIVFDTQGSKTSNVYLDTRDEDKHGLNRALSQAAKSFVDRMRLDGVPHNLHGVDLDTAQSVLVNFGSSIIGQRDPSPFTAGDNGNENGSVKHEQRLPDIQRPGCLPREGDRRRTHYHVQDGSVDAPISSTYDTYDMTSNNLATGSITPQRYQAKDTHHARHRQGVQCNTRKRCPGTRVKDLLRSTDACGHGTQPSSRHETHIHNAEPLTEKSKIHMRNPLFSATDEEIQTHGSPDFAEEIRALRLDNERLKILNSRLNADPASARPPTKWRTLHRVHCPVLQGWTIFTDQPQLTENGDSGYALDHRWHWEGWNRVAKSRLPTIEAASAPFIVYRDYDCSHTERNEEEHSDGESSDQSRAFVDSSECKLSTSKPEQATPRQRLRVHSKGHVKYGFKESVKVVSKCLQRIVLQLLATIPGLQAYEEKYDLRNDTMHEPYYFFYHFRTEIMDCVGGEMAMTNVELMEFRQLVEYFTFQSSDAHREAKAAFRKACVQSHLMPYLFKPGSLLLFRDDQQPICKRQTSTLEPVEIVWSRTRNSARWQVSVESCSYDGQFRVKETMADITMTREDARGQLITSLPFYPLEYASANDRKSLITRGNNFLQYCRKHYVTHSASSQSQGQFSSSIKEDDISDKHQTQVRYMIDTEAYLMLHEDDGASASGKIIEPNLTSEDFLCQLPAFVKGFHMVNKKWKQLTVDHVCPVQWNKAAFENLEVADDTKELIKALITNKIDSNESVDFVEGKGTGLVVLLHGGPGTGKTLTAETVAEIAERPLYRVSCGDIGTEASHVESYLTSVFYLGRRWGSVVLLDEADVFLEERSLDNLQRNALVSVFLRMIEYYDGILVLTSNRVGIFDEAFKSRIQLSLYYPNLDLLKRRQIWINFVRRLETLQESINKENIYNHIEDLAKYEMNGRQIRNAITSARQLSRYKQKPLDFEMLNSVINVGQRFEDYLREVKGHTADDYARHGGVR